MSDQKFGIVQTTNGRYLRVEGSLPSGFHGEKVGDGFNCPLDHQNAEAIRRELPWSAAQVVGLRKSVGCGDRLGIATPGHLRAIREGDMFPVLAQQSIREMQRANRTAYDVMDDATWGVIQAGYTEGFGCDADHLKTTADIDQCAAAGYNSYTLDPGACVDDEANTADRAMLESKVAALDWQVLNTDSDSNHAHYVEYAHFDELDYLRAAAKYGKALAHVTTLSEYIAITMNGQPFDLEISVDETATVTTLAEHHYIVLELKRLHIPFTGLAPRFVGEFEKGVDYIGNLDVFEASYKEHADLARQLGPYKMSIHSGSDKFSIYPIIARHTNPFVHLKTAGTSWLEALRVIAAVDAPLFRQLLALSIEGYETNSASYHVSAQPGRIRLDLTDGEMPSLLEDFDARETLHVAFGAALAHYREPIYAALLGNIEAYWEALHSHFNKHIQPFKA